MIVFKCFFKIIWKNKFSAFIYLLIFLAITYLSSIFYTANLEKQYADSKIPITIIDYDSSKMSYALTDYLGKKHQLINLNDKLESLQDALFNRRTNYILFVPSGFEKDFLAGKKNLLKNVKIPGSSSGIYIDNQIESFLKTLKTYTNAGFTLDETITKTNIVSKITTKVEITQPKSDVTKNSSYFFKYMTYALLGVILSALAPALIAFNQKDIASRIFASALSQKKQNIQIFVGCLCYAFIIAIIFISYAFILYGKEISDEIITYQFINILFYTVFCTSIAFCVGQLAKTTEILSSITNVISLGLSFLCGVFVPQELLGSTVVNISKFFPTYWYIQSSNLLSTKTLLTRSELIIFYQNTAIQLGVSVIILIFAIVISRRKKIRAFI